MGVNWDRVKRCPVWPVLGVTECDGCPSCRDCWGEETELDTGNEDALKKIIDATKKG